MRLRKDGVETRRKILEAAVLIFADKGYRDATISEICGTAGTNTASVNYHFGDKETLYVEAWRQSFEDSIARHPLDGGVPADAPPEERFRGIISATVNRVADPETHEFSIVHRELSNPTGLLEEVMRECVLPMRRALSEVIGQMLDTPPDSLDARLCGRSIMSQCIHMAKSERYGGNEANGKRMHGPPPLNVSPDRIAHHIFEFSLAGLARVRRQAQEGRKSGKE